MDEIVSYAMEQNLEDVLKSFQIDMQTVGDEYAEKDFIGRTYCEEKGIELYFNTRDHRFSASSLRKNIAQRESIK